MAGTRLHKAGHDGLEDGISRKQQLASAISAVKFLPNYAIDDHHIAGARSINSITDFDRSKFRQAAGSIHAKAALRRPPAPPTAHTPRHRKRGLATLAPAVLRLTPAALSAARVSPFDLGTSAL